MSGLEVACVIIGFILLFTNETETHARNIREVIATAIFLILTKIVPGLMVFLPLYFHYWKD